MPATIVSKNYLTFCAQSERDFLINICITGEGFHIVVTDHTGLIETDVLRFDRTVNASIFLRMVMGLTFLPDDFLGVDTTITCCKVGTKSDEKFDDIYKAFPYTTSPGSMLFYPPHALSAPISLPSNKDRISAISVNNKVYPVLSTIFEAKTLKGRATKVFLVRLPDGLLGVLKDSWITADRSLEATFLEGLHTPFCPDLINHCILRDTSTFRSHALTKADLQEI